MSGTAARTVSIRIAAEDVDSARSKLEALGDVGDRALKRVQQSAQEAAGAFAGVTQSLGPDAYAKRAADIAAYGTELDRLRAKFDPVFAASKRYEAALDEIAKAESLGAINAGIATRARESATKAFSDSVAPIKATAAATAQVASSHTTAASAAQQLAGHQANLAASTGATAYQMRALAQQMPDVVSGLLTGQKPFTILVQQGGQVVQVAGGMGAAFRTLVQYVGGPWVLAFAAGTLAVGGLASRAAALEQEAKLVSVALRAVGKDAEISTSQIEGYIRALERQGVARSQASSVVTDLVRTPGLSGDGIGSAVSASSDLSVALGTEKAAAAKQAAAIFAEGYEGVRKLDQALNFLTVDQNAAIKTMFEHGQKTEAATAAFAALNKQIAGLEKDSLTPMGTALRDLGTSWSSFMDAIATSKPIIALVQTLGFAVQGISAAVRSTPVTEKIDANIARLEAQLADKDSYGQPSVTGAAASVLRQQIANLRAERMLQGGAPTGIAANAPAPATGAPGGVGAATPPSEQQRQAKIVDDLTQSYENQRRVLAAGLPDRVRVRAEIQAEKEARDKGLSGLAAEELKRRRVAEAMGVENDARAQEAATLAREADGALSLARAADQGRAAMLRAQAAATAHQEAATKTGVAEAALAAAILNRNAAQEAAKGAEIVVGLNEQNAALVRLTAAEQAGARAAYYAALDEKIREATKSLEANRDAATDPAIKATLQAEVDLVRDRTIQQDRLNTELNNQRKLRAGREELEDLAKEASLVGLSADERERELAAMRALRSLLREGADPNNLTDSQKAIVDQARSLADANTALKRQKDLYDEIANSATQAFDQVGTAITNAFVGGQGAAVNWGNITRGVIASVLQEVVKLSIINPILNSVLGTSRPSVFSAGGTGGGGFSLGGVGGLFGGGSLSSSIDAWGASNLGFLGFSSGTTDAATFSAIDSVGGSASQFSNTGAMSGFSSLSNVLGIGGAILPGLISGNLGQAASGGIGAGIGLLAGGPVGLALGGLAGNLLGGLFGPGPKHYGWSWGVQGNGADGFGFSDRVFVDPVAQQQFQQEQQQIAQVNAWLKQNGLSVSGFAEVGGNNNNSNQVGNFNAGISAFRFSAANDNTLNAGLSGRAFDGIQAMEDFVTFVTQTYEPLTKAAETVSAFDQQIKAITDQFQPAIDKAKEYGLAEQAIADARDAQIAKATAARDASAQNITDTLRVRLLTVSGDTKGAALASFDLQAAAQEKQLKDQIEALGLAGTQYAADRIVEIEKALAQERLKVAEDYAAQARQAGQGLLAQLAFGSGSALAPEQQYFAALSLLNNAKGTLASGGSLSEFTSVAQQVLPVARDFLGTSERYASLVADVASTVSAQGGDPARLSAILQAQVDGTDALASVFARYGDQQLSVANATLSELRRLAGTLEALIARQTAA